MINQYELPINHHMFTLNYISIFYGHIYVYICLSESISLQLQPKKVEVSSQAVNYLGQFNSRKFPIHNNFHILHPINGDYSKSHKEPYATQLLKNLLLLFAHDHSLFNDLTNETNSAAYKNGYLSSGFSAWSSLQISSVAKPTYFVNL
ncbi:uncharacterized protein DS421_11g349430 [Arachis hypogaea]|nr:uncharacterized protein DS421_11g349430 [Arachis hypogaea]